MPDRTLKQDRDDASSDSVAEFPQAWEKSDLYLPLETEVSAVPEESRVVVHNDPRSPAADRFRWAGMRLKAIQAARGLKTLLITSPLPGDGKSTVALNLATVLTDGGKDAVLLVEADTYRPTIVKKLGLNQWAGLYGSYRHKSDPRLAIRRIDPLGIYLLPAGMAEGDDDLLFQSNFVPQLIGDLHSSSFSWVLIDSPPATPIAEILALKAQADATLLVARAGHTPREAIQETVQHLGKDHIIGIILNAVEGLDRIYSKYYGYVKPGATAKGKTSRSPKGLGLNKL